MLRDLWVGGMSVKVKGREVGKAERAADHHAVLTCKREGKGKRMGKSVAQL